MQSVSLKKFNKDFYTRFHKWEIFIPLPDGRYRIEEFKKENPEGFETPSDQYEAMIELVNGCRFSNTEYYVFMDDYLTDL